jgi:hypothetical protein
MNKVKKILSKIIVGVSILVIGESILFFLRKNNIVMNIDPILYWMFGFAIIYVASFALYLFIKEVISFMNKTTRLEEEIPQIHTTIRGAHNYAEEKNKELQKQIDELKKHIQKG